MLTSFFDSVLDAIRAGDHARIDYLLRGPLGEPDETHLGWSKGTSRGRAVGGKRADLIISSLEKSKAAHTGLLQDLEDSALFIEQIGPDIISDITTNVCKGMLLAYTQGAAATHGIPVEEVPSGPVWDPALGNGSPVSPSCRWPTPAGCYLSPRSWCATASTSTRTSTTAVTSYPGWRRGDNKPGSQLTKVLKSGEIRPDIGKLQARYPNRKEVLAEESSARPEIFQRTRSTRAKLGQNP